MRSLTLLAIATLGICGTASADLVLTAESRDLSAQPPETETARICLAAHQLAAESRPAQGERSTTIFDAGRKVVWHVEHSSKSYVELDEQAIRDLGASLDSAMQELRKQLAQMTDEQRKQAEQMMQAMPGAPPPKVAWTVQETAERQTILGRSCRRYDLLANGKKRSEVWAATWKDAGVGREALGVLRDFAAFFDTIAATSPTLAEALSQEGGILKGLDKIDAFPLRVVEFENSKPVHETMFTSFEEKPVDASTYIVPKGYTHKQLVE
jgi:hypothetical protein